MREAPENKEQWVDRTGGGGGWGPCLSGVLDCLLFFCTFYTPVFAVVEAVLYFLSPAKTVVPDSCDIAIRCVSV